MGDKMKKKAKYLGEILMEKGLVTEKELQEAIEEQLKNKEFLGAMLVEKGIISEDDLLITLADQFGIEPVQIESAKIDWELALEFPPPLIIRHKCFPISRDDSVLTLAIVNPLDVWVIESAEKEASPRRLKIVLIKTSDMERIVKEYRRRATQRMIKKWKKD